MCSLKRPDNNQWDHGAKYMPSIGKSIKDLQWEINELQNKLIELDYEKSQRRKAEASLRQSEENFRALAENANNGIVIVNQKGYFSFVNPVACDILGYSESQLLSMQFKDIVHPEEKDRLNKRFRDRLSGKNIESHTETVIVAMTGEVITVDAQTSLTQWKDEPASLIIFSDVSERKKAEEALAESERRFRELVDKLSMPIAEVGLDSRINYINRAGLEFIGYNDEDLKNGILIGNLVIPEQRESAREAIGRINKGEPLEGLDFSVVKKDGRVNPILLYATPMQKERKVAGMRVVLMDMTEIRKAEEAMKASEKRFRDLADLLPQPVAELDNTGTLTYINKAGLKITGYSEADFKAGLSAAKLVAHYEKERVFNAIKSSLEGKSSTKVEYTGLKKDGAEYPIIVYSAPILSGDESIGLRVIIFDLTDIKRAEKELSQSREVYRDIIQNVDEIIYNVDISDRMMEGRLSFVSSKIKTILGFDPEEFLIDPQLWSKLIHPDDKETVSQVTQSLVRERKPQVRSYRLGKKDSDEYIWLEDRVLPKFDDDGKVIGFFGAARDVTHRRIWEDTIKESEEQFRMLSEQNIMGILILQEGRLKYVNTSIAELGDISEDQLLDLDFQDILNMIHPDDREFVAEQASKKQAGEENGVLSSYAFRITTGTGKMKWVEIFSKTIQYKGKPADFVAMIDITERKKTEQALIDSEEKYRNLFNTMIQGVVYQDMDGMITSMNPAAEKILGIKFDLIKDIPLKDTDWMAERLDGSTIPTEDFPTNVALRTGKEVRDFIMSMFNPESNKKIWLKINVIPQFREGEEVPYQVYGTFEDITKQIEKDNSRDDNR
jgi:PAS domain S-box-containing protein